MLGSPLRLRRDHCWVAMMNIRGRRTARGLALLFFLAALGIFLCQLWTTVRLFATTSTTTQPFEPSSAPHDNQSSLQPDNDHKVLYIVTSLTAYDTGRRSTMEGDDRWAHTLVPVVGQSATSLAQHFRQVHVYLIAHYTINATQHKMLRLALPAHVDLTVWNDATPYGYTSSEVDVQAPSEQRVTPITRALARQHRYVIKDNMENYDLFVSFEDDMLIHGSQALAYLDWTQRLYEMRQVAPHALPHATKTPPLERFYGPMTKIMLSRMLPGFIRVEHSPGQPPTKQHQFAQVPVTLTWPTRADPTRMTRWLRPWSSRTATAVTVDPAPCCRMRETTTHVSTHLPRIQDLYLWETRLPALGLRQLPDQSWVLLQAGNDESAMSDATNFAIGDFWTGRLGYFDEPRPVRNEGDFMNNQGGWMATRRQILEWHRLWCRGSFLPPYEAAVFGGDGLNKQTVEFWSGGFQIAGNHGCNLQRMIPLAPDQFAQFLLYHTSNNKQKQKGRRHLFYGRHMQDFWGQLNTIRIQAEIQMGNEAG